MEIIYLIVLMYIIKELTIVLGYAIYCLYSDYKYEKNVKYMKAKYNPEILKKIEQLDSSKYTSIEYNRIRNNLLNSMY